MTGDKKIEKAFVEGKKDGWVKANPNNAECDVCHSTNLKFHFTNGEPNAVRCLDCNWEDMDK